MGELIKVSEYAKMHGKKPQSVRAMIQRGKIPTQKIKNVLYIDKSIPYPDRSRHKDITGQRYGRLVALKYVGKNESGKVLWDCLCDCGKHKTVVYGNLKSGYTKSCGCLPSNVETDVMGKKYGKLTPIKSTGKKDGHNSTIWECQCDCGNISYVSVRNLISEDILSCGCKKIEAGKNMQPKAVECAKKSKKSGRFETNINAKKWNLIAPDGREFVCTNLSLWARKNTSLFGFESGDDSARKIVHGFTNISQSYAGTRKEPVYTYKGWRLKKEPEKPKSDQTLNNDEKISIDFYTK